MNIKPFFCDPNGNFSQSKFWSNVAFTIASFVVLKLAWVDSENLGEIFLWYLVIVSGNELGKKFMTMKLSSREK